MKNENGKRKTENPNKNEISAAFNQYFRATTAAVALNF